MSKLQTLGSVSLHGKTFYFNRGTAKSGATYLAINGTTGDRRERLVIFDNQIPAFVAELTRIAGFFTPGEEPEPEKPCPECYQKENGEWIPVLGTGIPGETCPLCGRQL